MSCYLPDRPCNTVRGNVFLFLTNNNLIWSPRRSTRIQREVQANTASTTVQTARKRTNHTKESQSCDAFILQRPSAEPLQPYWIFFLQNSLKYSYWHTQGLLRRIDLLSLAYFPILNIWISVTHSLRNVDRVWQGSRASTKCSLFLARAEEFIWPMNTISLILGPLLKTFLNTLMKPDGITLTLLDS